MKKAIIYVRGHNQEMQEIFCRIHAADMGYKVLFVTADIEAVNNCDILLVANHSRLSRDRYKYYKIVNELKTKGIEVDSVVNHENAIDYLSLTSEIMG